MGPGRHVLKAAHDVVLSSELGLLRREDIIVVLLDNVVFVKDILEQLTRSMSCRFGRRLNSIAFFLLNSEVLYFLGFHDDVCG